MLVNVLKTFRQHRCETAALFMAPGKVTSNTKVQATNPKLLLQAQHVSNIQPHCFSATHVDNRHMTKLVLASFYQD